MSKPIIVTIDNYPQYAKRTAPSLGKNAYDGSHMCLGVMSEIQELHGAIEEHDIIHINEEIGDIFWYIANECNIYGIDFSKLIDESKKFDRPESSKNANLHDYIDIHKRELAYGKEIETDTLFWLLVDIISEVNIVMNDYGINLNHCLQKNIDKLYVRYPDKFKQEDALNRDLEKEREILEK